MVAGTLAPGTFTLHDQSNTNAAVQAEQQDELRAALGWTTNEQMEEALCKWSRCHRAGPICCCS